MIFKEKLSSLLDCIEEEHMLSSAGIEMQYKT